MIAEMFRVRGAPTLHRRRFARSVLPLFLLCLALTIATQAMPALADDGAAPLQIITDEDPQSGALFAARAMAIRYRAITDVPVVIQSDESGDSVLETYLDQVPDDRSILLFTHSHLIEMLTDPDGKGFKDIVLLARGISTPQVLVSRCDRFVDVGEILSADNRDRTRFGVVDGLSLDTLTARAFWQRVHGRDPIMQHVRDHARLIEAMNDGSIDIAIMSLSAAANRKPVGTFCLRLLLAKEASERFPNLTTAASIGIPVSVFRFGGYIARHHGEAEAREELARVLADSMHNIAYSAFLAHSGLDSNSVIGPGEWREQLDAMIQTLTPVLPKDAVLPPSN